MLPYVKHYQFQIDDYIYECSKKPEMDAFLCYPLKIIVELTGTHVIHINYYTRIICEPTGILNIIVQNPDKKSIELFNKLTRPSDKLLKKALDETIDTMHHINQ